ncbi:DUF4087 domain-containing protein [Microvirga tunisiensis]|uniref:DUF4087 domain-containing protein n=1 Tax=Pannonibacter tanglangensis TaxID=2750084 RepID=A0A7X5EZQ0_9HYPH|nr:DUF4087 domain-containing protein [Pannonibacter sp. XCT-53]NBN77092.1 DUF4087 domain-containing protein [Pannonibacter sp. XCT-53]
MRRIALALLPLLLPLSLAAGVAEAAPETRCGWVVNPTPGNWWLTDRDGDWILATQGSDAEALGMENIGDISAGDYKAVNGPYGYACGCMKVETEVSGEGRRITVVYSFKQGKLAQCARDKTLPPVE